MHSLLAKDGLATHDESISPLWERLQSMGKKIGRSNCSERGAGVPPLLSKARKWFVTRQDLDYSALWILHSATALARVEVIGAGSWPTARCFRRR